VILQFWPHISKKLSIYMHLSIMYYLSPSLSCVRVRVRECVCVCVNIYVCTVKIRLCIFLWFYFFIILRSFSFFTYNSTFPTITQFISIRINQFSFGNFLLRSFGFRWTVINTNIFSGKYFNNLYCNKLKIFIF